MRVIAGTAGGLQLDVPKTSVRPTMDRVKAAIFSSLGEQIIGARVLDLFAGTGGLGIEALSRGAASALFVEENAAAVATIERNLNRTKLEGRVRKQEVFAFLQSGQIDHPARGVGRGVGVDRQHPTVGAYTHVRFLDCPTWMRQPRAV